MEPLGRGKAPRASLSRWESKLGSSWMVAMRGLSRGGWLESGLGMEAGAVSGPAAGARAGARAGAEIGGEIGGVLVCWGPEAWKRMAAERTEGLKILTEDESRLLNSSAFWEHKHGVSEWGGGEHLHDNSTFCDPSRAGLTLEKNMDLVVCSYCTSMLSFVYVFF